MGMWNTGDSHLWECGTVTCGDVGQSPVGMWDSHLWGCWTVTCGDVGQSPVGMWNSHLWGCGTVTCGGVGQSPVRCGTVTCWDVGQLPVGVWDSHLWGCGTVTCDGVGNSRLWGCGTVTSGDVGQSAVGGGGGAVTRGDVKHWVIVTLGVWDSIVFYSRLCFPPQEASLRQSFSVLCCPYPYRSRLLPQNRLDGLVVKTFASRVADTCFDSSLRRDFSVTSPYH